MKVGKAVRADLIDRFVACFDYITRFDSVPFRLKHEAANDAADAAIQTLSRRITAGGNDAL